MMRSSPAYSRKKKQNNARWPECRTAAALFEGRVRAHDGEVRQRVLVELIAQIDVFIGGTKYE